MYKRVFVSAVAGVVLAAVANLGAAPARAQAPAAAPDAARVAAAKQMIQAAGLAKQFEELMPYLAGQVAKTMMNRAPEKVKEIQDVFTLLQAKFTARKEELVNQIAVIHAKQLTTEEIKAITAFYKSPVGVKFVAAQPAVMQETLALSQTWTAQMGREMENEARKELKKRGIDLG